MLTKIRAVVIALGISGQLGQILLQFPALRAPGEIGVGLREAELGQPFISFGRVKASARKITSGW